EAGEFGGCVWGDYDRDGWLDLFLAMNADNHRLYHNNRDGTFSRTTDLLTVGEGAAATWGDYDNDGFPDLFVANGNYDNGQHRNFFYHNNGDGTFTKITAGPVATGTGDSTFAGWADVDNDGDLDLLVMNHSGQNEFFYLNNGDGTFTKITQ